MYTNNYFSHSELGEFRNTGGNTYGLRVDEGEMWKFTLSGNAWVAKDKSGTTYTYGLTSGSRQDNPSDSSQVYRWYLEKVEDVNGNKIDYGYYKEAGQIYPAQIKYVYNGASNLYRVDFNRTPTPSRKSASAGFVVDNTYLINNIKLYTNGTVTREYNLNYSTPSVNSPFAQINSITELGYATNGNTTNTASFTYSNNDATSEFAESGTFQLPAGIGANSLGTPDRSWVLVDYNNDGLPDIIKSSNIYYKNNGVNWVLDSTPASNRLPVEALPQQQPVPAHFADINGDKLVDVIVPPSSGANWQSKVYLHSNMSTDKGWWYSSTNTFPYDIGGVGGGGTNFSTPNPSQLIGYQNFDLNGDNLNDYVLYAWNPWDSTVYANKVFLNRGSTITPETVNFQNTQGTYFSVYPNTSNGFYPESTYSDSQNDGLTDIFHYTTLQNNQQTILLHYNNAKGWNSGISTNDPYNPFSDIQGGFMSFSIDLNGDGYSDYLQQTNSAAQYNQNDPTGSWATKKVLINQHNDNQAEATSGGPRFSSLSLGYYPGYIYTCCNVYNKKPLFFVDVNGDGLVDIIEVISKQNEAPIGETKKVWINNGKIPGMMTGVTTSTGASYGFTYKSSAQYRDASGNSLNPDLPFTIQTLNTMTQNDGNGNVETYTYDYAGGYYYFNGVLDRKFAGFEKVTMTNPDNTKEMTYYHQGNGNNGSNAEIGDSGSKIGKVFRTDIYDSANNLKDWKTFKYDEISIGTDRFFVPLIQVITSYNGANIAETYVYDNLTGNLLDAFEWGYVNLNGIFSFTDTGTDKRSTTYTYINNATTNVRVPNNIQLKDQNGNKVTEKAITYDAGSLTKGNPTNIASWVSGSTYNNSQKSYNVAGQVTTETDPRGKATIYTYDSWNLLPTTITKPLSLSKNFTYNYAVQKPTNIQNENGRNFSFAYDGAGRVKSELIPNDANPTTQVTKSTYTYNDIGNSSQKVSVQKTSNDPTTNYYSLYDGLGRNVRNITQVGANSYVAEDIMYGQKGLVTSKSLPYSYSGSTTNVSGSLAPAGVRTNYYYLTNGDVYQITDSIGTTYIWRGGYDQVKTDPKNNQTIFWSDGFGRNVGITQKTNNNTVWNDTSYTLRADNKLLKITDAMGNVRNFTYDGEGKRLSAEDLHTPSDTNFGTYTYSYDAAGNMTTKVTPKGDSISYTYDDNNRVLIEKLSTDTVNRKTYSYDTCVDGKTKLCTASTVNSATYSYSYTPNGSIANENVSWAGVFTGNRAMVYTYDTQGNIKEITHPDSSKTAYTYGYRNLPTSISHNISTTSTVVTNITYNEIGNPLAITLGNGVVTTNTYDANKMYRLTNKTSIKSGSTAVQNESYTYDNVGNILTWNDAVNTQNKTYTYDDLYRLTSVNVTGTNPYSETYTYNAIGNILTKNSINYSYAQPNKVNPHAPTTVGTTILSYDNNGNLLTDGTRTNTWDYNNLPISTTIATSTVAYGYNHNNQRIALNNNGDILYTPNRYYNEKPNIISIKNIYLGDTLLATIDAITPKYNITNHLGSITKTLDNTGSTISTTTYKPYGEQLITGTTPQRTYIGEIYDPTNYNYLNARYYNATQGQFVSQDPVFWELGLTQDGNQALLNPQLQNSYSYAGNNPITQKDPSGRCIEDLCIGEIMLAATFYSMYNVADHYNKGTQDQLSTLDYASAIPFAGNVGKAAKGVEVVADTVKVGNAVTKTEKLTDIIKGFNHDGTYHGLNQIINRKVDINTIKETVLNPLQKIIQKDGRTKYVGENAVIVTDKAKQVVTGFTKNDFTQKTKDLIRSLLESKSK